MIDTDKREFMNTLKATRETLGHETTPDVYKIFWEVLKPYDIIDVKRAFGRYLSDPETRFPPSPGKIAGLISGATEDLAALAWMHVDRAADDVGPYGSVNFQDHAIHAAINEVGGWLRICNATKTELPFLRREFKQAYARHRKMGTITDRLPCGIRHDGSVKTIELPTALKPPKMIAKRDIKAIGGAA